jgi:hypothetical protein
MVGLTFGELNETEMHALNMRLVTIFTELWEKGTLVEDSSFDASHPRDRFKCKVMIYTTCHNDPALDKVDNISFMNLLLFT